VALSEFSIIDRYFSGIGAIREDVRLGPGDDCALLRIPPDTELAVTVDTLVEGVHFLPDVDPESLGHKALAVSLSDLAAMGAEPAWASLALTLPRADQPWLQAFARGFDGLARAHGVALVGGDMTRGPLSISIQAYGLIAPGQGLLRSGARPGDLIYVTGTLGDAALALLVKQGLYLGPGLVEALASRLERPTPRLDEGRALRSLASAAIDVSDGLGADLGHICEASGAGASIDLRLLPCSEAVRAYIEETGDWSLPLSGGDDYELCFTLAPDRQGALESLAQRLDTVFTWIGLIEPQPGVRCRDQHGELTSAPRGYDHFFRHG
jgi:thiamine-monophosphate kinase